MEYSELAEQALSAKKLSYAPYSNFHVGAALLTQDNKLFLGANIENASYGLTVCAERTAVFNALLEGEKKFKAIAITSDAEEFCPPCGACRQVLLELCGKELDVILINKQKEMKMHKLSDLIPFSFGNEYLKKI
ncbi:MAG: cytidine deaminase [Ignavibacteria bacterium RBG_13_36_8]|nr:MAG: cytidine deaminase [Ignavibacteria bacterium RBG_13_36_8]